MNCTDCSTRLHDYIDGELPADEAAVVAAHVAQCARCREQLDALRALRTRTAALPKEIAPSRDLWRELEPQLATIDVVAPRISPTPASRQPRRREPSPVVSWVAPLAMAAGIAFLCTVADRGFGPHQSGAAWSVERLAGTPQVDRRLVQKEAKFRVGQWLVTDAASRAKVSVGDIGHVTVDANSRLRLVDVAATNHRLQLDRGSLNAFIWAPPKIFFVNTPSATAVDYGCAYTLSVDDTGGGELQVTLGYVKLEHEDRESIIPMGMMCLTRRETGPGTPFASDAPETLRDALKRFDFGPRNDRSNALAQILGQAREQDTVTLWHLLARTEAIDRADVFDRLAKISAPPAGVTRDGILSGDLAMRNMWGSTLGLGAALP